MKKLPFIAALCAVSAALCAQDAPSVADGRGAWGIGLQRATWYSWGPSAMVDLFTPRVSAEAIAGLFPERAAYGRLIGRFLMLKGFNAYLAGGGGLGQVPNSDASGDFLVWDAYWSAYAGAELDLRRIISIGLPWFVDFETGFEARTATGGGWYPPFFTFALGTHFRF